MSSAAATCRQGKLKDLTDCAYTILPQQQWQPVLLKHTKCVQRRFSVDIA